MLFILVFNQTQPQHAKGSNTIDIPIYPQLAE